MAETAAVDYSLNNPDTLTKYKTAAQIGQKVLEAVSGWITEGAKIVEICQRGDKLLDEEVAKVYKGKKIAKGISHPVTVSPSSYVTPYTPLVSDTEEAETTLQAGEAVKIQLGAQIDGFGAIVCDTVFVGGKALSGRQADLALATHYANELLLRVVAPPGLIASGTEEEQKKAQSQKPYSQAKITQLLEKVVKSYECNLVENTTCWLFDRNEIEGKKKIILAPGEGVKGEGLPEVGEVWGLEIGVSTGNGKVKTLPKRTTLHRRTTTTYGLKRPSSRATLSEIQKRFGTFPFSLRQLESEKDGKVGVIECVRGGVVRAYEVAGATDGEPVSRLFETIAITKNGVQKLSAPPTPDVSQWKSDKKITDEEVLKILELPLNKNSTKAKKPKSKKKKAKKAAPKAEEEEEEESEVEDSDDEDDDCKTRPGRATPNTMPGSTTATPQVERNQSAMRGGDSLSKTGGKDGVNAKTFMDRWVEPSLAAPKASYEDHGAAAYGVLANMQPLGELPSTKAKQRAKGDGTRKSILGRSSAAAGGDVQVTPEGTPAPGASTPQPAEPPLTQPVVVDDEKDDDYAPTKNGKKKERSARPRAVKRRSEPSESAPPAPAPPSAGATKKKAASAKPRIPQFEYDGDKLKRVVEAAKARAVEVGKPDLADAVNEIYEQSQLDKNLRILLEAILTQNATPEQNAEFQDYVRAAKKKLKDAKTKSRHQPSVKTNGAQQNPPSSHSPDKKLTLQPAPSLVVPETTTAALPSTESLEPTKPKISLKVKSPSKDPNRRRSGNGKMSVSPKKRSGSVGSDSSLTSLTSNEDQDEMEVDTPPRPSASSLSSSRINGVQGKDHAAERGSLAVPNATAKRSSADADFDDERERALAAKKQKFSEGVARHYDYEESSIRPALPQARSRLQRLKEGALAPPSLKLEPLGSRAASVRGSRALSTDIDSPLSDLSPVNSRQSTPRIGKPLPKPIGKRAKTKQSPEKRQLAALGGMPGAGGAGRDSPIGDDDNEMRSENNDFCSACGGSGYLLCCDGCDRSFHFSCLDPPISDEAKELDEPWYCYICVAKKPLAAESPEKKAPSGLFAPLLTSLKKANPKNFDLPDDIKYYFEGVSADRNGAFIDAVSGKPTRNRPGYSDDQPDYYKLRDSKGNLALCYNCNCSTQQPGHIVKRPLVTCDHCHQHWHLDCLDPPLANPPALNKDGKKAYDWMCPLHVDQELRKVDIASLNRRRIHVRKPKKPKVAETALTRGHRNNGIIEVLDDESDSSDSEWYEHDDGPTVYKLPAHGIKLDFIDKVKDTRIQELRDERAYARRQMLNAATKPSLLKQANFAKRPFIEQQLALNLAQLAADNKELDLSEDQVENLIGVLIAEAPAEVVDEFMADGAEKIMSSSSVVPQSPPTSEQTVALAAEQRKKLLLLQELIRRKLEGGKT
ncbi:Putative peptidase M24, Zinc finger, PHD-type, Zinc finger, FYVE/PHD-type, creatinase/aminopeptidase [Septoria linicola]|uniref:Peptidase M24, Zinc finger, PHD-type, Zinc finger, FYVE/PHD-type, creatinase/aminopeptidase n=1 Tax=Septoria linicola TaxID=215465 RepID=A0A9Q9ENE5_9PEZI|nr:putative peptidase M24, Zinc finger, PHD-type, Zinc finger, FYVE/PHD-type, creatinase/aminopeptidase [Septoria linicola]USW56489.1 Putative peptidase M24, Zinc finger, PHD-type, Zinc finger, FYVE/PHD-type, creatinase/aminopeptidase [Septoria linicola]